MKLLKVNRKWYNEYHKNAASRKKLFDIIHLGIKEVYLKGNLKLTSEDIKEIEEVMETTLAILKDMHKIK